MTATKADAEKKRRRGLTTSTMLILRQIASATERVVSDPIGSAHEKPWILSPLLGWADL